MLTSPPHSICCTSFGTGRGILVNSVFDGSFRLLDDAAFSASDISELPDDGVGIVTAAGGDLRSTAPDLHHISAVSVVASTR